MRRGYGYNPGGSPKVSPAQQRRIDDHARWEVELDRLTEQGCDLLLAGRTDEFAADWQPLIDAKRQAEPAW